MLLRVKGKSGIKIFDALEMGWADLTLNAQQEMACEEYCNETGYEVTDPVSSFSFDVCAVNELENWARTGEVS